MKLRNYIESLIALLYEHGDCDIEIEIGVDGDDCVVVDAGDFAIEIDVNTGGIILSSKEYDDDDNDYTYIKDMQESNATIVGFTENSRNQPVHGRGIHIDEDALATYDARNAAICRDDLNIRNPEEHEPPEHEPTNPEPQRGVYRVRSGGRWVPHEPIATSNTISASAYEALRNYLTSDNWEDE